MINKKTTKLFKIYCLIGKGLCASTGSAIGFIAGGPIMAAIGLLGGYIIGHILEKKVFQTIVNKNI